LIKVIPAVDISGGKCVRLTRGKIEDAIIYYDEPIEAARRWVSNGAEILHIIDLDAAVGLGDNTEVIKNLIKEAAIPCQIGGGIRSLAKAREYADAGAYKIIFGTAAAEMKIIKEALTSLGTEKVLAAVDHLMGRVAVKGWKEVTQIDALTLCKRLEEEGVRNIMMTSIERDGMMKGPNLDYSLNAVNSLKSSVYLAGGFTTISDLMLLKGSHVAGVILGKALYEGFINFRKAVEVLK
jgi:phosphoribosylformimino-5-aminoimidazole carboxamide ribotide isomerase